MALNRLGGLGTIEPLPNSAAAIDPFTDALLDNRI